MSISGRSSKKKHVTHFFADRTKVGERENVMRRYRSCAKVKNKGIAQGSPKEGSTQHQRLVKSRREAG